MLFSRFQAHHTVTGDLGRTCKRLHRRKALRHKVLPDGRALQAERRPANARRRFMGKDKETILVHANVEMTASSLQAIVANAKAAAGVDPDGVYRVDTADKVSEMISHFLRKKDFESFVKDRDNY